MMALKTVLQMARIGLEGRERLDIRLFDGRTIANVETIEWDSTKDEGENLLVVKAPYYYEVTLRYEDIKEFRVRIMHPPGDGIWWSKSKLNSRIDSVRKLVDSVLGN